MTKKKPKSKHRRPGPKKKRGQPKKVIGPREIRLIRKWSAAGATKEQIAGALGMSHETYCQRQNENPDISEAFDQGKGKGTIDLSGKAYSMAMRGNKDLLKFLLERKGGFIPTSRQVLAGDPDNPLPAAQTTVLILPANGREIKPDAKGGAKA